MKGKELAQKRFLVGLTQEELAKRTGVTKQTICNIETGRNESSEPLLRVIDYEIGKAFVERDLDKVTSSFAEVLFHLCSAQLFNEMLIKGMKNEEES